MSRVLTHTTMTSTKTEGHREEHREEHPKARRHPPKECTIDCLPAVIARLSLLLPSVLQHFEHAWMTDLLCQSVLKDIPFRNHDLILTAITSSSLQWSINYECLEFLGDSILKLVVSVQLYDQHKSWPEGYLTQKRAALV